MRVKVLGSAQDGGVPHLGCGCGRCRGAREDRNLQRSPASVKVYDEEKEVNYLFDVSPDIRFQVGDEFIDGIFVSHAHLGHLTGLLYLGTEAFNADRVPVYCSEKVDRFLHENPPYRLLMDRDNVETNVFADGEVVDVMGIEVTPFEVVNKGYVPTDTHAFTIQSDRTTLFYVTDVDRWAEETLDAIRAADIAIIDGCFWSAEEVERYQHVPHPPMEDSIADLAGFDTDIYFTHMNHTNPVLDPDSPEREMVEENGFRVVDDGMEIEL